MKPWIAFAALAACQRTPEAPAGNRAGRLAFPVDVARLELRGVQYTVTAPGSLEAFQAVQITARVAGAVDRVAFVEGQQVQPGDVLVAIARERYEIAVAQARTTLQKAQATQRTAQAALERRLTATRDAPGVVPGEEIAQKQILVDTARADREAAGQALQLAELDLRDASVRAPIAGIVQTRTVQQGQYLQAGAVLATILQREPMLLRFGVSERDAPRLQPGMVAKLVQQADPRPFTATIALVAGAADPATRMVPVTARLDPTEPARGLRPGGFCEVTIRIGNARSAVVVPSLAVQPTEQGNLVYIVGDDHTVHGRVVELGMHTSEGGVELTRGVTAGELLVVRGIEPLGEGAPVTIVDRLSLEDGAALHPEAAP